MEGSSAISPGEPGPFKQERAQKLGRLQRGQGNDSFSTAPGRIAILEVGRWPGIPLYSGVQNAHSPVFQLGKSTLSVSAPDCSFPTQVPLSWHLKARKEPVCGFEIEHNDGRPCPASARVHKPWALVHAYDSHTQEPKTRR